MIVLDTNVISELFKPAPHHRVVAWFDALDEFAARLTAVTVAELRVGVARMPNGRRQAAMGEALEFTIQDGFDGRVLPFDVDDSAHYADIVARRAAMGRPMPPADGQIAAICRRYQLPLATRNTRDFQDTGIDLVDPWAT